MITAVKPIAIVGVVIIGATVIDASAALLKMTCSGSLTNTRADGVTLGQCDLNFISMKEKSEIENVCGIPGTVDSPAKNQCRIRAVVSPDPAPAADNRKLYRVLECGRSISVRPTCSAPNRSDVERTPKFRMTPCDRSSRADAYLMLERTMRDGCSCMSCS